MPLINDLGRLMRYHAGRFLLESVARCPRSVGLNIGRRVGAIGFRLVARDRRIALDNVAHAWPELSLVEQRALAREVFERLGENIYDVASLPGWTPEERRRHIEVTGMDQLSAARAAGRGVILIGGHQGAWELVAPALSDRGLPVVGLARPIREARLDRWLDAHRAAIGTGTIKVGGVTAARRAHRLLADGGVLGMLIDHRIRTGGKWFDFFGRPSRFATGPARLAIATGAVMVPVAIARREDGGHRITIGVPLHPVGAGPAAVDRLLGESVAALERMIRNDPASWAWMHPRWGRPARSALNESPVPIRHGLSLPALLVLSSLLAGAAVFPTGCGDSKPPAGGGPSMEEPSSVLSGVTLRETFDGKLRWVLSADSSETFHQPERTIAKRVHVDFHDALGVVTSVLTADEGVVQRANNDMTARGHVVVITVRGDTLTTERLDWSSVQNRVRTDLPFRLGRPDGVMTGVGFESDPDLTGYTTQQVRIDARDAGHD